MIWTTPTAVTVAVRVRARYHPHDYGAFVLDLDGNNVEAVVHTPG